MDKTDPPLPFNFGIIDELVPQRRPPSLLRRAAVGFGIGLVLYAIQLRYRDNKTVQAVFAAVYATFFAFWPALAATFITGFVLSLFIGADSSWLAQTAAAVPGALTWAWLGTRLARRWYRRFTAHLA